MKFACARALRVCALLALPTSAFAQSAKTPTIFSPSTQVGTVNLRAAVVLADYTVKPLPLLKVVAQRSDRPDSAVAETDLDGRVAMSLKVGTYTLRARTAQPVAGRAYGWAVRVVVRPQQTQVVQLTNSNASTADSVGTSAMVADAAPATPPTSVQPSPANRPSAVATEKVVAPSKPAGNTNKVVASAQSPKQTAPASAPAKEFAQPTTVTTPPASVQPAPAMTAQATSLEQPPSSAKRAETSRPRRTNTSGLMLGLSFAASSIRSDDFTRSTESGPGVGGTLGWGITKNFAFVIDASAARISSLDGDFDLAHADVGGRWHFVNRSALVPFIEVGYAGRAAMKKDAILSDGMGNTYTGDLAILGSGVSAGGGFEYFATSGLALGGSVKITSGQFTQVKFDKVTVDGLELDATSARFNMGFTWYPMGRGR